MESDVSNTMQVQHLDFELVRPTIQVQQTARSSEDSGVLDRHASVDLQLSQFHRDASPARSLSGPRTPIRDGFRAWSRQSVSASVAPTWPISATSVLENGQLPKSTMTDVTR
jgi:hypothetical protein